MFLSTVNYDDFWSKIKLIGYTMKLRVEHMRQIAPHLNFKYREDMLCAKWTPVKGLLADDHFGFDRGHHDPHKLLLVGLMYCHHDDEESINNKLWRLVDPNFRQIARIDDIMKLVKDLVYIATRQRLYILNVSGVKKAKHLKRYLE